jgi:hypothetical protein
MGRSELLARVQLLESKLELSRTIGTKLLEQEEQYQAEIEGLQDKLWHMEEQLVSAGELAWFGCVWYYLLTCVGILVFEEINTDLAEATEQLVDGGAVQREAGQP